MRTLNVLVTSIGGPVAQGILKGLKEIPGIHIIGADRRQMTSGNLYCDKVYKIPRFTESTYINYLGEIIENESIDVFFPGHPLETELYEEYRTHFDIPVALTETDDYKNLLDKEQAYLKMESLGLDAYIPLYIGFSSNEELIPLLQEFFSKDERVIVKETTGYGAIGMAVLAEREHYLQAKKSGNNKVMSIEDYLEIADDTRRILMNELKKPEYSVDVYVHENQVVVAVPRKREGVSNGLVLEGTVEQNYELIKAAEDIAGSLVDNGFINMQFMLDGDCFKLTDVNPRFCGSQVMSLGAGVNFPKLFIQYEVFGEKPEPTPLWGTRMMRYRDTYFAHPKIEKTVQMNYEYEKQ